MKSTRRKLLELTLKYFTLDSINFGLCYFVDPNFGSKEYRLMHRYAEKWPLHARFEDGGMTVYFIPANENDLTRESAMRQHDYDEDNFSMVKNPMRRKFANYMLREICREMKIKIVQLPE